MGAAANPEQLADYKQRNLPLVVGLYEAFKVRGRPGQIALFVYLELLCSHWRQSTDRPWVTDAYLKRGLRLGVDAIKDAKAILCDMGLISYVQDRTSNGTFGKVYIKLNQIPNPGPALHAEPPALETPAEEVAVETQDEEKSRRKPNYTFAAKNAYCGLYRERTGEKIEDLTRAQWGKVRNAVAKLGVSDLLEAFKYLRDNPMCPDARWLSRESVHWDLGATLYAARRIAVRLAKWRARETPERHCLRCGKTWQFNGPECPACHVPLEANNVT